MEDETNGKEDAAPTYATQYPELNKLVGFEDGDVIDIVAPEKVGKTTFGTEPARPHGAAVRRGRSARMFGDDAGTPSQEVDQSGDGL